MIIIALTLIAIALVVTIAGLWVGVGVMALRDGWVEGDWSIAGLGAVMLLTFAFTVLGTVAYVDYQAEHPCIKSHRAMVHHDAYTTFILAGKIMVPQYHDAYDAEEDVCDQRK